MSVQRDQTERIAALARLYFEPEELDRLTEELNHILEHVERLKGLEEERPDEGADRFVFLGLEGDGTRGEGAESPDALDAPFSTVAPDWREGFFVVPPLPGMHDGGGA